MSPNLAFLARLLPARLRRRPVLAPEKRRELWASVGEHDPCLRAVLDTLQEGFEQEFLVMIDPGRTDGEVLRAAQGLRRAWHTLQQLEDERAEALEWKQRNETENRR